MKILFDNQAFLASLSPDVNKITKLKSEKKWIIGTFIMVISVTGFLIYQNYTLSQQLKALKNGVSNSSNEVSPT